MRSRDSVSMVPLTTNEVRRQRGCQLDGEEVMRVLKTLGTHIFVAVLASAVTVLLCLAALAGASVHEAPAGTIYSQSCTVNASVYECSAGQGCRHVKDPLGHVANGSGTSLECKYP
jgi:hypothetical protein